MDRVSNKVAIVTGEALGIGRSACSLLAGEGAHVAGTDLLDERGQILVEEITPAGGSAAFRHLDENDALLYAADRIHVNSVNPGFIWTPLVKAFARKQGDVDGIRKELDDIGWGIIYLASDEAKFIAGSELVIDRGYVAR